MAQRLVPFIDAKMQKHDGIYLDLDSELLWYNRRHRGKLIKFSTGKTRAQLAQAKQVINEELPIRLNQPEKKRNLAVYNRDELMNFLKSKESLGLDETTVLRIRSTIKLKIRPYWDDLLTIDLTQKNIDSWVSWYKEQFPGETMDNAVKYLRNYSRHLNRLGLLSIVPVIKDPDQKRVLILRKRKTDRVFTPEERAVVLGVAVGDERLAGTFMAAHGARIEETLTLKFDEQIILNTDPPLYRWSLGQNKADHEGQQALHPVVIDEMRARYEIAKAAGTKLVFPQLRDISRPLKPQQIDWHDWRKRADLGWHWSSKTFRHTLLTELFNNPDLPQLPLCKQYRISPQVAMKVYVKTTVVTMELLNKAVKL